MPPEADRLGSDCSDCVASVVSAYNPGGGLAGSLMSVAVAGEELEIAEMARELPSSCLGPSVCILCGCTVMVKVHGYSGSFALGGGG